MKRRQHANYEITSVNSNGDVRSDLFRLLPGTALPVGDALRAATFVIRPDTVDYSLRDLSDEVSKIDKNNIHYVLGRLMTEMEVPETSGYSHEGIRVVPTLKESVRLLGLPDNFLS